VQCVVCHDLASEQGGAIVHPGEHQRGRVKPRKSEESIRPAVVRVQEFDLGRFGDAWRKCGRALKTYTAVRIVRHTGLMSGVEDMTKNTKQKTDAVRCGFPSGPLHTRPIAQIPWRRNKPHKHLGHTSEMRDTEELLWTMRSTHDVF